MALDESAIFDPDPEPRTQADYIRALWKRQGEHNKLVVEQVIPRLDTTNGRVTRLERGSLIIGGAVIGWQAREAVLPLISHIFTGLIGPH